MININLRTKREINIAVVSVCCLVRDMRAVGMSHFIFKTDALRLILIIVLFIATILFIDWYSSLIMYIDYLNPK